MPERAKIPRDPQTLDGCKRAVSLIYDGFLGDNLTIVGDKNGRYSALLKGPLKADPAGGIFIDFDDESWGLELAQIGMFPVLVTQSGGSAGGLAKPCSYTYTVLDLASNALGGGAALAPNKKRPAVGPMVAPAAGSYGTGFYDLGVFKLFDPNEALDAAGCSA